MNRNKKLIILGVSALILALLIIPGVIFIKGLLIDNKYQQFMKESIANARVGQLGETLRFDGSFNRELQAVREEEGGFDSYGGGALELTLNDAKVYSPSEYLDQYKTKLSQDEAELISSLSSVSSTVKFVNLKYTVTNIDGDFGNNYTLAHFSVMSMTPRTGNLAPLEAIVSRVSGLSGSADEHGSAPFPKGTSLKFDQLYAYYPERQAVYRLSDVEHNEVLYFDLIPLIK